MAVRVCNGKMTFFKYIIEQKVESISDLNWDLVLTEKPFLTRKKITLVLNSASGGSTL